MKFTHREIAPIYSFRDGKIGEYVIRLNEDRPGILAALANIFADHGVNILHSIVDRDNLTIHFIVDFSGTDIDSEELSKIFKNFSFVKEVHHRLIDHKILIPITIPTFKGSIVIPICRDLILNVNDEHVKVLIEIFKILGKRDGELIRDLAEVAPKAINDLSEFLKVIQSRGLGIPKYSKLNNNNVEVEVCDFHGKILTRNYVDIVKTYLKSYISSILNVEIECYSEELHSDCVVIKFLIRR